MLAGNGPHKILELHLPPEGQPTAAALHDRRLPRLEFPAARDKALSLRHLVQDGRDPLAEAKARQEALTVAAMIARFLRHAQGRLRSWRTYEDLLRRDVIPVLGDRRADDIVRTDVANLLDRVAERAPVVANRVQNTLN